MKPSLAPGATAEVRHRVVTDHLVSRYSSAGPAVLSTPWLLFFMEHAAFDALLPHLDEGEHSVGIGFDFQHLAPTLAGATVVATAEVLEINGNQVTLRFEARDDKEVIGRGTHVRAVLELDRFQKRIQRKSRG